MFIATAGSNDGRSPILQLCKIFERLRSWKSFDTFHVGSVTFQDDIIQLTSRHDLEEAELSSILVPAIYI